ncbi:Phosphoglycerate mutase family protein [Lasiodiplodia theobromae]|uniref:Phosphoglycerate mutase family protein n=1 Tax=Lasiodiplodia theobromae TaxID=45133 RepID=UPI0015C3CB30|nr:Phosphoglycerate mutase family protein [Lasiodiplodia theobromae]KAF4534040.1 Phosphoglycerate mutase family protein [Lasiodiplodia theobromae]
MPPTLYLVRHAEGEHNVNRRHHLRDPHLTPLGHTQCAALCETFPDNDKVSIVMASPLKRTIQTASYCFGAALARPDVPFLLVPHAQEVAANPCDTGFAADELKAALPEMVDAKSVEFDLGKIDFGLVEEGWNSKSGIYTPSFPAVERRAALFRAWLRARPEENIVLVTHGAFLHYLMEDWTDYDPKKGTGFCNCEVRRYGFAEDGSLKALEGEASKPGYVKGERPDWVNKNVLSDVDPMASGEEARL